MLKKVISGLGILVILIILIGVSFTNEFILKESTEGKTYSWKISADIQGINNENGDLVKELIDVILVNYVR